MLHAAEPGVVARQDPEEREREEREFVRLQATVRVAVRSDHTFWTGLTRDIGEGGVFVVTSDPLPVGSVIELSLALGEEPSQALLATVRWVRPHNVASAELPPGMGLAFLDLPDTLRVAIQQFIDERRDSLYYDDPDDT